MPQTDEVISIAKVGDTFWFDHHPIAGRNIAHVIVDVSDGRAPYAQHRGYAARCGVSGQSWHGDGLPVTRIASVPPDDVALCAKCFSVEYLVEIVRAKSPKFRSWAARGHFLNPHLVRVPCPRCEAALIHCCAEIGMRYFRGTTTHVCLRQECRFGVNENDRPKDVREGPREDFLPGCPQCIQLPTEFAAKASENVSSVYFKGEKRP